MLLGVLECDLLFCFAFSLQLFTSSTYGVPFPFSSGFQKSLSLHDIETKILILIENINAQVARLILHGGLLMYSSCTGGRRRRAWANIFQAPIVPFVHID